MAQLGNIEKSYGKNISLSIANASDDIVLNSNNLPINSLIICAPYNKDTNEDLGNYSIIATDYLGNPVKITSSIIEGNGLTIDNDSVYLNVSNNVLNSGTIGINTNNIIDNKTIISKNNKLQINVGNLRICNDDEPGLYYIDNSTIKNNENNQLYVDTIYIDYASLYTYGKISIDNYTIKSNDGIIYIDTNKLDKCSNDKFGIASIDNSTIILNNEDKISVNSNNLDIADVNKFGLVNLDNYTLKSKNGVIYVDTENLQKCSDKTYGTIKINDDFEVSSGLVGISKFDIILSKINECENKIKMIEKYLNN